MGAVKGRFDGLDVTAMVANLQKTLQGRRIVNIYDGDSGESYIFKLEGDSVGALAAAQAAAAAAASNTATGTTTSTTSAAATTTGKHYLLLESGIRFHTLQFFASESPMPSPFCAKLRKHLRGLRLEQILQIGSDRVVLLQFGSGPNRHAVILELYSKGNLILVDLDYKILALLRSHVYENTASTSTTDSTGAKDGGAAAAATTNVAVQVGQVYPVTYATSTKAVGTGAVIGGAGGDNENGASGDTAAAAADASILSMSLQEIQTIAAEQVALAAESGKAKKGKKGAAGVTLKTLLLKPVMGVSHYGPTLLEHCILTADLVPSTILSQEQMLSLDEWKRLQTALQVEGPAIMKALQDAATTESPGYVLYRPKDGDTTTPDSNSMLPHTNKILEEFQPHLLKQHNGRPFVKYDSFALAVDDFFAHLVSQKRLLKANAAETAAKDKLEKFRQNQEDRVSALEKDQDVLKEQAAVVQLHADNVEKALTVVNSAVDSGMDWDQLEQLVEVEQNNGNHIALLIHKLELEQDAMVLRLPVDEYDEDSLTLDVRISLKESAHANASALFGRYRASKEKSQKTIESSTKALKAAEETAQRQLADAQKRGKQVATVSKRKPLWFEKFHWFITSDNYLVLGGRDAHQNETLVKRYLRAGDAYLHADVHGASSCVLRAKRRRLKNGKTQMVPLSEQALREAGNFTICRSSAWTSRMVTSAWWVESHQVSKTAPTGEYLTLGSFMVRGKKNFLPPTQLEMGLAVLFRLGDDDHDGIARHKNERRDFSLMELEDNLEEDHDEPSEVVASSTNGAKASVQQADKTATDDGNDETQPQTDDPSPSDSGFQSDDDGKSNEDADDEPEEGRKQKKGLSVRDRKLIKKHGSLEEAERVLGSREKSRSTEALEEAAVPSTAAPTSTDGKGNLKRGKKAKMKRAKKKYEDQDDEDRELAMLALQGGEKIKKQKGKRNDGPETETQLKVAAETTELLVKDPSKAAAQLPEEVRSLLAECVTVGTDGSSEVRWDKFDADTLEQLLTLDPVEAQTAAAKRLLNLKNSTRIDNFSASLNGILRTIRKYGYEKLDKEPVESNETAKRKSKAKKDEEALKWKQTMAEEGIAAVDLDDDAVDDTLELSKLTGKPDAEDLLLYAVPVCAPYQTLSKYAFRVKLTPGNMKRGKAAKQCVDMFYRGDTSKPTASSERIKDLVKKVGDNDWVQVICADVKISAAGASKATKKHKANKKKSKK